MFCRTISIDGMRKLMFYMYMRPLAQLTFDVIHFLHKPQYLVITF